MGCDYRSAWVAAIAVMGMSSVGLAANPSDALLAPTTAPAAANVSTAVVTQAFLEGKINELEAALGNIKDASVAAADRADLNYIRMAVGDDRPVWWKQIKTGRTVNFRPMLWGRTLAATFDPASKMGVEVTWNNSRPAYTVTWAHADMDVTEQAEHGFTKGELCDLGVWMNLGNADAWGMIPPTS